jgi:cytochrome P450
MADAVWTRSFDDSIHDSLHALRAAGPVAHDAESGAVVVLEYEEIERLAHDQRVAGVGLSFFDFMGIGEGNLRRWYGSLMFTNEGPNHHRLRRLVARAFTPRSVERHRALAADLTRARLDAVEAADGGDLVDALADVPINVICRLLGVPDDRVGNFLQYGDALSPVFGFMDEVQIRAADAAVGSLLAEVDRMIGDRTSGAGEDLISALLVAEEDGDTLSHEELVTIVGNLIVGGHDTTASQVGCSLLTLLRHPEVTRSLAAGNVPAAHTVNETIRFEPSIAFVPRTLTEPVVIGGEERPAGSMVFLCTASANRQDSVWGDPLDVRPARFAEPDAPRLLSFGSGAHFCLGAALARMTLEEVVSGYAAVSDRLEPTFDLEDVAWRQVLGRSPATLTMARVQGK